MRKLLSAGVVVAIALAAFAALGPVAPARAGTNTTVVLSFDQNTSDQMTSKALLDSHDMPGTFYVVSNTIGTNGHLSYGQLQAFQASGSEIAGHTLDHIDLTTIPTSQAKTQVCDDRTALQNHGLTITDFAYPFGAGWDSPSVRNVVQQCGYTSARMAFGLYSVDPQCGSNGCGFPYADTSPPADMWAVKTDDMPDSTFTLARIEGFVTQAEQHGGGIVTIVFHENLSTFGPFLDWLAANGAATMTMAQALVDAAPVDGTAPTSSIACNGAACSSSDYGPSMHVSLSATDNAGGTGVASIRYTTDGTNPTLASAAYSAPFTLSSTTTVKYRAYDNAGNAESTNTQVIQIDAVAPVAAIACRGVACSSRWYAKAVPVSLSATDSGCGVAAIYYTIDGTNPTLASPVYSAPFTLAKSKNVKYRAVDNVGNLEAVKTTLVRVDTTGPTVAITSPARHASVTNSVKVSAHATDAASGVVKVNFLIDGKFVAADTKPAYAFTWNANKASKGVHTLTAKAFDAAGNSTATSITVTVH